MDELEKALQRHEQRKGHYESEKDEKKMSRMFTKVLLSVILVLSCTIYMKLSEENKEFFKKNIFESNLAFTKVNSWYHDTFGNILPTVTEPKEEMVSGTDVISKEKYLDGYKVEVSKGTPIKSLAGGLFVYMGEKEGYGNTYIIQGVDGVDIWYGGITDTNLKLYDYIDAGTILGVSSEDVYYLAFQKNGEFLSYEDYTTVSS